MKTISVFGLGKLGCCMVGCFARAGYRVIGVDVKDEFVDAVNSGEPSVVEPGLDALFEKHRSRISATNDAEKAVLQSDVSFIIVPTPSLRSGEFFTSYAQRASAGIGNAMRQKKGYHLVVLTSTVLPGASRRDIITTLESHSGRKCGRGFGFCYSPEFIAIGNVIEGLMNPDLFLIGEYDKKSGDKLERIYRQVHRARGLRTDAKLWLSNQQSGNSTTDMPRFARMSIENAELTKIAVNTFVTNKISFANTLGRICSKMPNGDAFVVAKAVGLDKRIGSKYLKPGSAFGGPCFPRDNRAFAWFANSIGEHAPLAKATDEVNWSQIEYIVEMLIAANPKAKKVGLLGLSYKDNTNLMEESQSVAIAESLIGRGYDVTAYDPEVVRCGATREVKGLRIVDGTVDKLSLTTQQPKNPTTANRSSGALMRVLVERSEVVVIATNHAIFKELRASMFEGKKKVLIDLWGMHLERWRTKPWYIVPGVAK